MSIIAFFNKINTTNIIKEDMVGFIKEERSVFILSFLFAKTLIPILYMTQLIKVAIAAPAIAKLKE